MHKLIALEYNNVEIILYIEIYRDMGIDSEMIAAILKAYKAQQNSCKALPKAQNLKKLLDDTTITKDAEVVGENREKAGSLDGNGNLFTSLLSSLFICMNYFFVQVLMKAWIFSKNA